MQFTCLNQHAKQTSLKTKCFHLSANINYSNTSYSETFHNSKQEGNAYFTYGIILLLDLMENYFKSNTELVF
jgi:hypothetical protein